MATTTVRVRVQNVQDIEYLIGHLKHEDIHLYEALLKLRRLTLDIEVPLPIVASPAVAVKLVNFSLGGALVVGQRVTPKPPVRLRGEDEVSQIQCRCIFVHGNVDTPGTTRSVFDILVQPADETEPRYSILAPGDDGKLIIPANTREQTILESGDLGGVDATSFLDGDFFTLDILEAGAGARNGHVLVGFVVEE